MSEQFILVIGVYPEVVRRLGRCLEDAGYAVHMLTDAGDAEAELAAGAAAVITSPYLSPAARQQVATAARRGGSKVVMLHAGEIADTELADAVVSAVPGSVVEALRHLLPRPRERSA